MSNFKIKETYLLFLIVIGLISLAGYSTYALFTASTEIEDVVEFSTSLSTNNSIVEYEMVTVPAGETKIIELNITNSYTETLYYGAWYEMVSPSAVNDDIEIGLYTEKNNTPGSGSIASGITLSLLVGVANNTDSELIINIGTAGSLTSSLGLAETRILIPTGFSQEVVVTEEYLEAHTEIVEQDINYTYTIPEMAEVRLGAGTYKLEAWGAQGGSYDATYIGGKGGYSYGTLTLTETTDLYVYVGGQAATNTTDRVAVPGGFNGGGKGFNRWYSGTYTYGQGGGGASDIRIGQDDLYARVIVAGGGSGSTNRTSGYYGGGETSGTGQSGYSASQTAAGTNGSFGVGGSATTSGNNYKYGSAGGGGGWYGGGASSDCSDSTIYDTYTGGGSGYVYTSSTASNYPTGCLLNSSYYLTDAATVAGNVSFTDYNGSTVTGHAGNGAVKITGRGGVETFSIPRLIGIKDVTTGLGISVDLTKNVTMLCADGRDDCEYLGVDISDTSILALGMHNVHHIVKMGNTKYKYPITVTISELSGSELTMALLNLNDLLQEGTPDFSVAATTEEGIYAAEDDLGTSYYFRGASDHNYVLFDNKYWRIIRINGDGSVRVIYDGTSAHEDGESSTDRYVTTKAFNSNYSDNAYVGYMYGTVGASTYSATHENKTDSTIKAYLEDTWYPTISEVNKEYIVDAIYCNDREVSTADSNYTGDGSGTTKTWYKAAERLNTNSPATPVLTCSQKEDRFTLESTNFEIETNGKLDAPVGLITADEMVMAGGTWNAANSGFYLYSGNWYWTMSPRYFNGSYAYAFDVSSSGNLYYDLVSSSNTGVRPVLSLSSSALTAGTGKIDDPFRISS